jgi:hypothetical protein
VSPSSVKAVGQRVVRVHIHGRNRVTDCHSRFRVLVNVSVGRISFAEHRRFVHVADVDDHHDRHLGGMFTVSHHDRYGVAVLRLVIQLSHRHQLAGGCVDCERCRIVAAQAVFQCGTLVLIRGRYWLADVLACGRVLVHAYHRHV